MAKKLKKLVFAEGRWGSPHSRFVEGQANSWPVVPLGHLMVVPSPHSSILIPFTLNS